MGSEHWLPVPGYEGLFEVSDVGRVRGERMNTPPHRQCLAGCVNGRIQVHAGSDTGYPVEQHAELADCPLCGAR